MVSQEQSFDLLDMGAGLMEPFENGLLFDAFGPMDARQADAFCQQSQTFEDSLLGMVFAIEDGSLVGAEGFLAGGAAVALHAALGASELDDVVLAPLCIIRASRVPAEGT